MILRAEADKLTIISEDSMDVKYLESLFEDLIQIKKESNFVCNGFHETSEQRVCVTLVKQEEKKGG